MNKKYQKLVSLRDVSYKVMKTPPLVVDNKLNVSGGVPTTDEF